MSGIPQPQSRIPGRGRGSGLQQPSSYSSKTKTLYATPLTDREAAPTPSGYGAPRPAASGLRAPSSSGYGAPRPAASGLRAPGSGYGRQPSSSGIARGTGLAPLRSIRQPSATSQTIDAQPIETTTTTTIIEPSGKKTTKTSTTQYASQTPFATYKKGNIPPIPTGKFVVRPKEKPWSKAGKLQQFSSPVPLRGKMDQGKDAPKFMFQADPKDVRDYQILQKHPLHSDLLSGNIVIDPGYEQGFAFPEPVPLRPHESAGLDEPISAEMIESDWNTSEEAPLSPPTPLERETERKLLQASMQSPDRALKGKGAGQRMTSPKVIMTDRGPVEASVELKTSHKLIRSPHQPEITEKKIIGIQRVSPGKAIETELDIQKLDPKSTKKSPVRGRQVVEIISSVVIGPGVKESTISVEFEGYPEDNKGKGAASPDPRQVSMMVDQEIADVNRTKGLMMPDMSSTSPAKYGIKKHVEIAQLTKENVSLLERSILHQPKIMTGDEVIEETDPEVIASILNTEERGLAMDSSPANVYNYLFPEAKIEPLTIVSSAAPAPLQDIVIPSLRLPDQVKENVNSANALQISMQIERQGNEEVSTKAFIDLVGKEPIKPVNIAKKGRRKRKTNVPLLATEIPPWGIQDLEPVMDLVGGPPVGTMVSDKTEYLPGELDPTVDGIEYMLQVEPPQHFSRVQLRGSHKPSWFPGYLVALPQYPQVIKLAKSPSEVFSSAWRATQPDIFTDDSMYIV